MAGASWRPVAVYAFLRTGLRPRSSAVEPDPSSPPPRATEEVVRVGSCIQTVSGLVRDPLAIAPGAYACNEVMSARPQVALAAAAVVS